MEVRGQKKRKGGAERERIRKRNILASAKYSKIRDMFTRKGRSQSSDTHTVQQHRTVVKPASTPRHMVKLEPTHFSVHIVCKQ